MGAITASETRYALPLELRDTLGLGYHHAVSPYNRRSEELLAYADGLKALPVPDKLTVAEASSLFEIWKVDMAINSSECIWVLSGCRRLMDAILWYQTLMTSYSSRNMWRVMGMLAISCGRGYYPTCRRSLPTTPMLTSSRNCIKIKTRPLQSKKQEY